VKSIFQYHVPPPVIKSKVANENKLSFATIESQLATALKKIEAYSKLNKILVRKLDATSIDEEMGRYK
jgi:hypothetical protein